MMFAMRGRLQRLPRVIWVMGGVSLFADFAGEMAYPLLPIFVTGVLGASPMALGLIEGVAEALVCVVRALTGYKSDVTGHRVRWVRRGYAIAFAGKVLVALAAGWGMVLGGRLLDRVGKGIRGAPRDALIAEVVDPRDRGRAFGFHRGIDSLGGVGGSLVAAAILAWLLGSRPAEPSDAPQFRLIFLIAASAALVAWLLTLMIPHSTPLVVSQRAARHSATRHQSFGGSFWIAVAALVVFSLGNSSDAFLLLRALELGHSPVECILLYATLSATYAIASYPMGALSDRIGRWPVLSTGWAVYALVYGGFALVGADNRQALWGLFALYGVSVACTEGTARALIADIAPRERLATAMGVFGFLQGGSLLVASLVAGWLWTIGAQDAAFWVGCGFALVALMILPWVPRREAL